MNALFPFNIPLAIPVVGTGIATIDRKKVTSYQAISQVLYLRPSLDSLATNLQTIGYEWAVEQAPAGPNALFHVYDRFNSPLNPPPLPRGNWTGRNLTGLDIDLTAPALGLAPGWIAIAVDLGTPAGHDVTHSTLNFNPGDTDPLAALTFGDAGDTTNFSWITEDEAADFPFGINGSLRQTFVFVCKLSQSGTSSFTRFNLGVSLKSTANPNWALPLIVDPEIKNDG